MQVSTELAGEATKSRLGFAHLLIRQASDNGMQAGRGLLSFDFEGALLGSSLFADLKVLADADSIKISGNPPGSGAGRVFKPAHGKLYFVAEAKVATSIGNFVLPIAKILIISN
jgi:hypothetical protein